MNVTDKFLRYVSIDTQSINGTDDFPDTSKQQILARLLCEELKSFNAEVNYDSSHCYVYASYPASEGYENCAKIALISHMDTSPAASGNNIRPQIIKNFDGNDILLNPAKQIVMKISDFPELSHYTGQDLIVTDGTTLLGADDKAGIAEIMAMLEYFHTHPDKKHGPILIAFTPNEEVGFGTEFFDVDGFGADIAYTVDGGALGEIEYENFNAASATLIINGRSVHPGDAKNKMLNAILIAQEFQSMLPVHENPMYTEKYEGFYHLDCIYGNVECTTAEYIIRDHYRNRFETKKERFMAIVHYLNEKYGENTVNLVMKDSYYNMKEIIEQHMHPIDNACIAMKECGVTPNIIPIRGGTDGARLSFMGLPCPNLSTGGMNFHGRFEYIPVQSMEKMVDVLINLIQIYSKFNM